jgi:Flp pilus assembly pilin Flp
MNVLQRWFQEESGSELVEYALLVSTVAILSAAALALMPGILKTVYEGWNSGTQTIWEPCDPGGTRTNAGACSP